MPDDLTPNPHQDLSFFYRLFLGLVRPLGLRWVGDNELGVVYRKGLYHDLRGPGSFWINPFIDVMKEVTSVKPDFVSATIPNVQTRDALQLGFGVALSYVFDPRDVSSEQAAIFVEWPQQIRRLVVTEFATRGLQSIIPKYTAEQVCRGELFDEIEEKLKAELNKRLPPLALTPKLTLVREVIVPPPLQDTFNRVVRRAVYTQDLGRYEPFEISQAERQELFDVLRDLSGGIRYVDLSSAGSSEYDEPPRRRVIEGSGSPASDTPPRLGDRQDEDESSRQRPPRSRL